jgi:hypothetical protein
MDYLARQVAEVGRLVDSAGLVASGMMAVTQLLPVQAAAVVVVRIRLG